MCGLIADFTAIVVAAEYAHEGGLRNFFINTSSEVSLFSGLTAGVAVSTITTILVSMVTYDKRRNPEKAWEATLAIDNPLNPWRKYYEKELTAVPYETKITSEMMWQIFKRAKHIAVGGFIFSIVVFVIVIPSVMLSIDVLTKNQLSVWLTVCRVWMVISAAFAIVVPPIEEAYQIYKQYKNNRY